MGTVDQQALTVPLDSRLHKTFHQRKEQTMFIPSDQAQIVAMKRMERERVVYENSRRDCLDLARNSAMSPKEIHTALTGGYGAASISIGTVRRLCNRVR
jgi:hypothetical protein